MSIPRLGWSMEEGVFAGWLKQDGEQVRPGDRLESDKATEDVEALDAGILAIPADGPRPGDTVRVGQEIGLLLQPGEAAPVVRDALSLRQLAAHTRDLVERARQRRLRTEEMQGGTFTVSNLGGFGIDAFTPIIPVGQCAILGLGRIQRVPAVVNDQVAIRDRITLSLTFDHRIVDGAPAARFLQTLAGLVENPAPALVE